MTRSLILFDIDGTLMITKGAGSRCLERAGRALFGQHFQFGAVTAGRLDPQIYQELADHNQIDDADRFHDAFRDCYLAELEAELDRCRADVLVLPGVRALLTSLDERARTRGDVVLGLLSGNYRQAAYMKLAAAGIDLNLFAVQALAEDGESREALVLAAIRQAEALTNGRIAPGRTVIIGDTPRDVACGSAHGCRVLAVATGRYDGEILRKAGATCVVPNLAEPGVLDRLLECAGLAGAEPGAGGAASASASHVVESPRQP